MGNIEKRGRARARKRDLQRAILGTVSAVGLLAVAMVAPNLPSALKKLGMLPTNSRDSGSINRARNTLIKKGLLAQTKEGFLKLTADGERALLLAQSGDNTRSPRHWDGRWRVLIFDIPETRRLTRDKARLMLLNLGFTLLQGSVWVYPHDCEEVVTLLKAELRIGKQMLYLIVDEMEGDARLRRRFGLK